MKSFKEYLKERYSKWDNDLSHNRKFESGKNNIYYSQSILKNMPPELKKDIVQSLEKSGKLPTGKEYEDVYKAIFVINHLTDVKNPSAIKDNDIKLHQEDYQKILDKTDLNRDVVVNAGKDLIKKVKDDPINAPKKGKKEEPAAEEEPAVEEDPTAKEEPTAEENNNTKGKFDKDGNKVDKNGHLINKDGNQIDKDGNIIKSQKKKVKEEDGPEEVTDSGPLNSPSDFAENAKRKIDTSIRNFRKKLEKAPVEKKNALEKTIVDFEKKANAELKEIQKQEKKFSVYPTASSKSSAITKSKLANISLDQIINNFNYKSNKIERPNRAQIEVQRLKDTGNSIKKSVGNITNSRNANIMKEKLGQISKKATDAAKRTGNAINNSQTKQAIDRVSKKIVKGVDSGVSKAIEHPVRSAKNVKSSAIHGTKEVFNNVKNSKVGINTANVAKTVGTNTANAAKAAGNGIVNAKNNLKAGITAAKQNNSRLNQEKVNKAKQKIFDKGKFVTSMDDEDDKKSTVKKAKA